MLFKLKYNMSILWIYNSFIDDIYPVPFFWCNLPSKRMLSQFFHYQSPCWMKNYRTTVNPWEKTTYQRTVPFLWDWGIFRRCGRKFSGPAGFGGIPRWFFSLDDTKIGIMLGCHGKLDEFVWYPLVNWYKAMRKSIFLEITMKMVHFSMAMLVDRSVYVFWNDQTHPTLEMW